MGASCPNLDHSAGSGVLSACRASWAPNTQCPFRRESLQSSASFLLVAPFLFVANQDHELRFGHLTEAKPLQCIWSGPRASSNWLRSSLGKERVSLRAFRMNRAAFLEEAHE